MEQNWYSVTTAADRDWEDAKQRLMPRALRPWDTVGSEKAREQLTAARAEYRRRILGWYRKLCLPMRLEECVPNMVAELLAEEWDLATRHP